MNNDRIIAETLANSMSNCSVDLDLAIEGKSDFTDEYNTAAEAIVEPRFNDNEIEEEFQEWMDRDINNWANLVRTIGGDKWYEIAKNVAEEGY